MLPSKNFQSFLLAVMTMNGVDAAALAAYNADPKSVSVSGLSSGGFMAAQLGIAHSNTFQTGFGVFAGGPYDCARNQPYSACMNNRTPNTRQPNANLQSWSGRQIDDTANLRDRKVFLQVGTADSTVGPNPMNALNAQLESYLTEANTEYITVQGQAHVFPTDFDATGNGQCGQSSSPYISNCGYDGAGSVLQSMYGALEPRTNTPQGSLVSYDQSGEYGAPGMAQTGSLYVPPACQDGSTVCRLHVALHGCQQTVSAIGNRYITNTGYDRWADSNNILVLFPQGIPDYTVRQAWTGAAPNPFGCWDWIGWYGDNADQKGGVQMEAIVAQVNRIISGFDDGDDGGEPLPTMTTTTREVSPTTTSDSPPASTTSSTGPCAPLYGQCAGRNWGGPKCCKAGTCTSYSEQYGQCL